MNDYVVASLYWIHLHRQGIFSCRKNSGIYFYNFGISLVFTPSSPGKNDKSICSSFWALKLLQIVLTRNASFVRCKSIAKETVWRWRRSVRKSYRFWAGLWSDLIIEQTLMCSIKCTGGLTRGRGIEESISNLWIISISCSATVFMNLWSNFQVLV